MQSYDLYNTNAYIGDEISSTTGDIDTLTSSNITSTNITSDIIEATTINVSNINVYGETILNNLNANEVVRTTTDKSLTTVGFSSTSTSNALALRDANGKSTFNNLKVTNLSVDELIGINVNNEMFSVPKSSNNVPYNVVIRDQYGDVRVGSIFIEDDCTIDGILSLTNLVLVGDSSNIFQIYNSAYENLLNFDALSKSCQLMGLSEVSIDSQYIKLVGFFSGVVVSDVDGYINSTDTITNMNIYDSVFERASMTDTVFDTSMRALHLSANSILQTDSNKYIISSNTLPSSSSATNLNLTTPKLTGSTNQILQTDGSNNIIGSNSILGTTLISPKLNGSFSQVLITDSATNIIGTYTLSSINLSAPKLIGSASQILQTNGSNVIIGSNTLPSGCSATTLTLTTPKLTGSTNQILQTDGSNNIIGSNSILGTTLINPKLSGSFSQVLITDGTTNIIGTYTLSSINLSAPRLIGYASLLLQTDSLSTIIGSNSLPSGCSATTMTLTTPKLAGSTNQILQTDGSNNIVGSNTLPSGCSATTLTLTTPKLAGSVSQLLQTDGSNNITGNNTLPANCSATSITLTTPKLAGSVSQLLQTNGSNVITGSNTLPASCTASNMFLTSPRLDSSINQLIQTNGSNIMIGNNVLPSGCSATSMTLTTPILSGNTLSYGSIYPNASHSYNLGTTSAPWQTIYCNYLGFGNNTTFDINHLIQGPNAVWAQCRAVSWNTFSNERMKKDIKELKNVGKLMNDLRPVSFKWKRGYGDNIDDREIICPNTGIKKTLKYEAKEYYGFIAEEICEVLPYTCSYDENNKPTGVDYSKIIPLLVASIKEMNIEIKSLKNEILTLNKKIF
jgi:hypothetical protein